MKGNKNKYAKGGKTSENENWIPFTEEEVDNRISNQSDYGYEEDSYGETIEKKYFGTIGVSEEENEKEEGNIEDALQHFDYFAYSVRGGSWGSMYIEIDEERPQTYNEIKKMLLGLNEQMRENYFDNDMDSTFDEPDDVEIKEIGFGYLGIDLTEEGEERYAKGGEIDKNLTYKGDVVGFKDEGTGRAFLLGEIDIPKNSTPKSIIELAKSKFKRTWFVEVSKDGEYLYEIADDTYKGEYPAVSSYAKGGNLSDDTHFVIQRGNKRLSSVYSNELGYRHKWVGYSDKEADDFGNVKVPTPNKIFVFRENSWITFDSKKEAEDKIDRTIEDIKADDRYDDKIKNSLIKSAENLKKKIIEVKKLSRSYAKGGSLKRSDNSPLLKYVNFEDGWFINLKLLNPTYQKGYNTTKYKRVSKDGYLLADYKYGISRQGPGTKQEVWQFETLKEAEKKYNELVNLGKTFSKIEKEGEIKENYSKYESLYYSSRPWMTIGNNSSKYFEKGGKVKKKENNEMIMGGLAGILLGIFLNK